VQPAIPSFEQRLAEVRRRIARAAERSHRDPGGILLLAVSKIFPAEAIHEAYALGLRDFGENYVQEFERKAPGVKTLPGARFHFIGHLQSNKSARAAELFDVVQTIDSPKLARRLNEAGLTVVVITNQSGVARGYFEERDLERLAAHLRAVLADLGVPLLGYYACPHLPGADVAAYAVDCDCRKPSPGLIRQAIKHLGDFTHLRLVHAINPGKSGEGLAANLPGGKIFAVGSVNIHQPGLDESRVDGGFYLTRGNASFEHGAGEAQQEFLLGSRWQL
jgi:histidinol-phosphate phosphatase family protein